MNLKIIGLALESYRNVYGSYPPAYVCDKNGQPMYSWRVLLLPFIGEKDLYKRFRLDEAWNGPHNRLLVTQEPTCYKCPADISHAGATNYVAIVGPAAPWEGAQPRSLEDLRSATGGESVLVAEMVDSGIIWMEPRDLTESEALQGVNRPGVRCISSHHPGGAWVWLTGEMRFLQDETPALELRSLVEIIPNRLRRTKGSGVH